MGHKISMVNTMPMSQLLCLDQYFKFKFTSLSSLPTEWCVVVVEHPFFVEVVVEAQEVPGTSSVTLLSSFTMRMPWDLPGGSSLNA